VRTRYFRFFVEKGKKTLLFKKQKDVVFRY
jgi:hypothetical protein